ncbi:hypothetical protein CERZMDRAFT_100163 [Cercospora zeae-maydis SCOH1-5]|uniref:F-box domain-containing protein n=1 Tax=Cercospora zeae-maydis SCOH1-5 TaxID=717836 RepID=A0A6A6F8B7_9PEZI|nr:hypothetical protein CERZMDRAFT_100163 [Cercospora zeae-maydis SCOH1-5]
MFVIGVFQRKTITLPFRIAWMEAYIRLSNPTRQHRQQIDVTKDLKQQLPGELVANIASYAGKEELNNFRLISRDTAAKSSTEFARKNLDNLRIKILVDMGFSENKSITELDRFDCCDIEAAIKIIDDYDRGRFVQEIMLGDVRDSRKTPTIDPFREPLTPGQDQDIASSKVAKSLNTLFSKLPSVRKVELCLEWRPSIPLVVHALCRQPQLRLTSLALHGGVYNDIEDVLPVLKLFAPSLRSLHLTRVSVTGEFWNDLFEHIRDEAQLEEVIDKGTELIGIPWGYPLNTLAFSNDFGPDVSRREHYILTKGSAVMRGKVGVKKGAEKMLKVMRRGLWG